MTHHHLFTSDKNSSSIKTFWKADSPVIGTDPGFPFALCVHVIPTPHSDLFKIHVEPLVPSNTVGVKG